MNKKGKLIFSNLPKEKDIIYMIDVESLKKTSIDNPVKELVVSSCKYAGEERMTAKDWVPSYTIKYNIINDNKQNVANNQNQFTIVDYQNIIIKSFGEKSFGEKIFYYDYESAKEEAIKLLRDTYINYQRALHKAEISYNEYAKKFSHFETIL